MHRTDAPRDLQSFVRTLRAEGLLVDVRAEVDPHLEVAEVHRRVYAAGGPALLFWNVRGARFPLVTNLYGTRERVERAFGRRPAELVERAAALPRELFPPRLGKLWGQRGILRQLSKIGLRDLPLSSVGRNVVKPPRLTDLPATRAWFGDGGRYLTMPLLVTHDPVMHRANVGLVRAQVFDDETLGLQLSGSRGGALHLARAEERGQPLHLHLMVGGPPAATLAALAPLPEDVPELLLASLLAGERLDVKHDRTTKLPYLADAEFVIQGRVDPGERRAEGPFGGHYGYSSRAHQHPLVRVERVLHRKDALVQGTVFGKPPQEDTLLVDYLQELFAPLVRTAMPSVQDLWCYGEAGYHSLAAAVVRNRYPGEAMTDAFRLLGEGQLALTKFLVVVDRPLDLKDFRAVLTHVLARCDFGRDLYLLSDLVADELDVTTERPGLGGKGVLVGVGEPVRTLPEEFRSPPTYAARRAKVFSPGCVVVESPSHRDAPDVARVITEDPGFDGWPLVILTDDLELATRDLASFLWTTFTRFDPARDVSSRAAKVVDNRVRHRAPLVIDARRKVGAPEELVCDPETAALVQKRWREYFPGDTDVEMG